MAATVLIPTPLQRLTNGEGEVRAEGGTIQEILVSLEAQFPGIQERLCDANGKLRRFANVYLNGEDIRHAQGQDTPVRPGDEISIIPAVAGG
ncbi:MAG: MoaD/ThiS family protein [Armatimonadetes bacterium]|nr:MoaD/ThiS family protein [Armatimonadota bacterium]